MGEIVRYKRDVWGEEVILGVSWDLLWLVAVVMLVLLAAHAIIMVALARKNRPRPTAAGRRVVRHAGIDRAFHWLMAASVLVLIFTGIAPILGLRIVWLEIHWIAGLLLTLLVLAHIVRALFWQDFRAMLLTPKDFSEPFDSSRKPGKYYFEQKAMHWTVTVVVLAVILTGGLLLLQIDTPFWERRNSMPEDQLGLMFLLHGLATLALVALTATHIYFALRPEKFFYTRSMISGWVSEDELATNHDPSQWTPKETD